MHHCRGLAKTKSQNWEIAKSKEWPFAHVCLQLFLRGQIRGTRTFEKFDGNNTYDIAHSRRLLDAIFLFMNKVAICFVNYLSHSKFKIRHGRKIILSDLFRSRSVFQSFQCNKQDFWKYAYYFEGVPFYYIVDRLLPSRKLRAWNYKLWGLFPTVLTFIVQKQTYIIE